MNRMLFNVVLKITHTLIVLSEKTKKHIALEFGKYNDVYVLPNTVNDEFVFVENKNDLVKKTKRFVYISNYI